MRTQDKEIMKNGFVEATWDKYHLTNRLALARVRTGRAEVVIVIENAPVQEAQDASIKRPSEQSGRK